jgi:hypothetical protein
MKKQVMLLQEGYVMCKFTLLGGCASLMIFSIVSSQANAQDWGGVVGGLAGGMIAGAIMANQQPHYYYYGPVRRHYYAPRHHAVVYAAPRRQYTHTVTTAASPAGPSGDDLRGILGSHD